MIQVGRIILLSNCKNTVNNVVFPTGAVLIDKKLLLYYGGADKIYCTATAPLDELIENIMKEIAGD